MARCDQCGNDYDKSFEVTMAGRTMTFELFRVRDSGARANLPALRQPHHRARCRAKWHYLLLRALRQEARRNRLARPRLTSRPFSPGAPHQNKWRAGPAFVHRTATVLRRHLFFGINPLAGVCDTPTSRWHPPHSAH